MSTHELDAVDSALAKYLKSKADEESLLQIGKRKPPKQITNDERLPSGRARWTAAFDFTSPSPLVDRPRTLDGATSFHFSYITISKKAVPTVGGKPIEGSFGSIKSTALKHSKYIERDGAAEFSLGAHHAAYVERPDAVERVSGSSEAGALSEEPNGAEAEILGRRERSTDTVPSIFSNISDDEFERQEYWRAVEKRERNAKTHEIVLDPTSAPAWWAELGTTNLLDSAFQRHALDVLGKYRAYVARNQVSRQPRKLFVADPFTVSGEKAGKIIESMRRMPSYREEDRPFVFKSGPGGRTQIRIVAELPHELTAEDRALIVQNFVDHLGSLEERTDSDGNVRKVGLMYTAVIHAPDAHNDCRNYHLHVVAHDRPARFMVEHGMWDFEVQEEYVSTSRNARTRYRYDIPKIKAVQRTDKSNPETSGINFIPGLRRVYAEINNAVLKARGIRRRLDPRTYQEMGVDRTPTEHLGTKAAALESIGVPTVIGKLNAISIYDDAQRAIDNAAKASRTGYDDAIKAYRALWYAAQTVAPDDADVKQASRLIMERDRLIRSLPEDRQRVATFDLNEAKAKSRAVRTRATCARYLDDIFQGKADARTVALKNVIQKRFNLAEAHIVSVDRDLERYRATVRRVSLNIEACEKDLVYNARALDALEGKLRQVIEASQKRAQSDPLSAEILPTEAAAHLSQDIADLSPASGNLKTTSGALNQREIGRKSAAPGDVISPQKSPGVEPLTMGGVPIVEASIKPRQDLSMTVESSTQEPGMELASLRPQPQQPAADQEPEIVRADITKDGPEIPSNDEKDTMESGGQVEAAAASNGPEEVASRQSAAPTPSAEALPLFSTAKIPDAGPTKAREPQPPVKPGTAKAEYDAWDKLMKRISDQRIPIKSEKLKNGDTKFSVPSLSPADQQLLNIARFGHRTNSRLAGIEERHTNEIQRLIRWVKTSGQNTDLLILEDRSAKLGGSVKPGVRTLMKHWGSHPAVGDALRAENKRRLTPKKAVETKPQIHVAPTDSDLENRRELARKIYPPADQVFTREVAEFSKLLRQLAPKRMLQLAADKIRQNPAALEDISMHTLELAEAFRATCIDASDAVIERPSSGLSM